VTYPQRRGTRAFGRFHPLAPRLEYAALRHCLEDAHTAGEAVSRGWGGVAGVSPPVCYQRPGLPDADARTSGFEGLQYPVRPHVRERPYFGYEGV